MANSTDIAERLYNHIAHGDVAHRAWLKAAIATFYEAERLRAEASAPPTEAVVEAVAKMIFGHDFAWDLMLEKNKERYREKALATIDAYRKAQGERT